MCWFFFFFFSSRRRHTRSDRDWSSDVCSSDLWWAPRRGRPSWRRRRRPRERIRAPSVQARTRSEEHTSELQSRSDLVCRLLLEKKKKQETRRKNCTPKNHHPLLAARDSDIEHQ